MIAASGTAQARYIPVAPAESLWVEETGQGTPVVLLPGLFGAAYEYRTIVPLLSAAGHRVIIIVPLGIGRSGRPAHADYSLTAQAARVGVALDSLGVSSAVIVARAVASSIALRLALARPSLVRGVVSLEGGVAEAAMTPGFRHAMTFAPLLRLGGAGMIRGIIAHELKAESGNADWVTDSAISGYTAGAAKNVAATLRAYQAMGRSVEPDSLATRLGAIRCPVLLLLGGAQHPGGPPSHEVTTMRHGLAAFAVDTIPGAGHFLQEEAPRRVAAVIDSVAAALPPPSTGDRP